MEKNLQRLQTVLQYNFKQVNCLRTALTHSSYANEKAEAETDNERLEFLGDAVLELCISGELFLRFPDADEGALTRMRARLVSEPALAAAARRIGLDEMILLGRGEEGQGGRDRNSIVSDTLEAVFGAVYLDGGLVAAQKAVMAVLGHAVDQVNAAPRSKDAKSRLQELTQKLFKDRPVYTPAGSDGPDHAKVFKVVVQLPDGREFTAQGAGMKKAEQKAAEEALAVLSGEEEISHQ